MADVLLLVCIILLVSPVTHGACQNATVPLQVYEFFEQSSQSAALGTLYVSVPPPGLPLSALLAQVLSRAMGCPFTLPLHPLLEVPDAAQLAQLQPVLHAGAVTDLPYWRWIC